MSSTSLQLHLVSESSQWRLAEARPQPGPCRSPHHGSPTSGGHHTCGLADGGIACWGHNDFGQLGDGTTTEALSPVPVTGSDSFTEVSAGGKHSCGARATGEIYCWGNNEHGQLGDGGTTDRLVPTLVALRLCCRSLPARQEGRPALLCACAAPTQRATDKPVLK
jgi:hypothetical protein